jgi:hypothetical protein
MDGLKNSERFTFEWMTPANNRDFLGKVLMMGSVSYSPLGLFRTNGWSSSSSTASLIEGSSA